MMKKHLHFKMPQRNIQDKEMMLRSRKFTPKRKKHFKIIKKNIQDKEMMLRSKKFSGTSLATPPLPPATKDQLQAAEDLGEQATALPPAREDQAREETAQNLIGFDRRDGDVFEQTERTRRVKRPVNKFV